MATRSHTTPYFQCFWMEALLLKWHCWVGQELSNSAAQKPLPKSIGRKKDVLVFPSWQNQFGYCATGKTWARPVVA